MDGGQSRTQQRPRELRRRVSLRARVRSGSAWCDGTILNISSRGMLLQVSRAVEPGSWIELREGAHSVSAQVMWRSGFKAGVRAERPIPIDDWLVKATEPPRPAATHFGERRTTARSHDRSREIARGLEFAVVASISVTIAASAALSAARILTQPLEQASATLAR